MNTVYQFLVLFSLFFVPEIPVVLTDDSASIPDSLLLEKFVWEVKREQVENPELQTPAEIDSVLKAYRMSILSAKVVYAPDSAFKVFVVVVECCGAYCNSTWHSRVFFNLKEKPKTAPDNIFTTIESIHRLPDGKYLVIEENGSRPAGVLTLDCKEIKIISFTPDSMIIHPVKYKGDSHFGFCQEVGVVLKGSPYINYNEPKATLSYYYGNNYDYCCGENIDTIRQGQFRYINGEMIWQKEKIKVNDRRE